MAINFPDNPTTGAHHTHDGKTWTFHDGKWALNVSAEGVRGPAGIAFQGTAPATTDVLWADTSVSGVDAMPIGGTTGQMLTKASSTSYDAVWATPVTSSDLALKAPLANPTFTGTVAGVTKTMVGLGSVDNTADSAKPVSTEQQTALDLKAPLASPALTGTPTAPTATAATNTTQIATTAFVRTEVANLVASAPAALDTLDELAAALGDDANFATTTATAIGLKAPLASPALTGTPTAPTASVGTNTTQIATTEFVQVANPTGAVIAFAGSSAPTGWFLCGGQEVAIASYGALYAVIGTTYGSLTNGSGGAGTTHFRVPDLRGRTVAGIDNMTGTDAGRIDIANSSGTVVGSQYVTLTSAQSGLPAHSHANTLTSATVGSSTHRHEFGFALNDNYYQPAGTNAAMATPGSSQAAGAYRYSTSTYQGAIHTATVTDTRQDAGTETISVGSSLRFSTFGDTEVPNATTTVGISNVNNTAANAASAVSLMQPTMVLNYIIKA